MRLFALSQMTQYVLKDGYRGLALLYRLVCEILEEKRKKSSMWFVPSQKSNS